MRFETFQDDAGEWRWRLVAGNGAIVADSAEGYGRRNDAERAVVAVTLGVEAIARRNYRDRRKMVKAAKIAKMTEVAARAAESPAGTEVAVAATDRAVSPLRNA